MSTATNLLRDKIFHVQDLNDSANPEMSLPEVLAALYDPSKEIIGFSGLQPFQTHAWYSFLAQLCAISLSQNPSLTCNDLTSSTWWAEILTSLTKGEGAWLLVNDDLQQPAFMQPPVSEGNLGGFKNEGTPDSIDILVLSKNHDVKQEKIHTPNPSHWVYALVNVQTMQGYTGKFNYGIARMNGGYGNRSCIARVLNPFSWGLRLRTDVPNMLKLREKLCEEFDYRPGNNIGLLWLLPWDGEALLQLHELDPFFIEVCRRLRIVSIGNKLVCLQKLTKSRRVDAENRLGHIGDSWMLITNTSETVGNKSDKSVNTPKALTVSASGFSYNLTHQFFNGTYKWPHVQTMNVIEKEGWCLMQTLVRGQGETQGYHERLIPFPAEEWDFFNATKSERIAKQSEKLTLIAGDYQKILRNALLAFYQGKNCYKGETKDFNFKDKRPNFWIERYERKVDDIFFPQLWKTLDAEDDDSWELKLKKIVQDQFGAAVTSNSSENMNYFKNRAEAEGFLNASLKKITTKIGGVNDYQKIAE